MVEETGVPGENHRPEVGVSPFKQVHMSIKVG